MEYNENIFTEHVDKNFYNYYIKWDPSFGDDIFKTIDKYGKINKKNFINLFKYLLSKIYPYGSNKKIKNEDLENDIKYKLMINVNETSYNFLKVFSSGSSGVIFLYYKSKLSNSIFDITQIDKSEDALRVLKLALKGEEETSKNESAIHYVIDLYQRFYNLVIVPELDYILMTKDNFYHLLMKKIDCDLYEFFDIYPPLENVNELGHSYFIEFLTQICKNLILLQDNFQFMHNDLKCNNILVKGNGKDVKFILCDLGGSSFFFTNRRYVGSVLGSDNSFDECKDMFHLIHMFLSFSKYRYELIKFIEEMGIFNLDKNLISTKESKWIKVYTYLSDGNKIDKSYNPRDILKKIS